MSVTDHLFDTDPNDPGSYSLQRVINILGMAVAAEQCAETLQKFIEDSPVIDKAMNFHAHVRNEVVWLPEGRPISEIDIATKTDAYWDDTHVSYLKAAEDLYLLFGTSGKLVVGDEFVERFANFKGQIDAGRQLEILPS